MIVIRDFKHWKQQTPSKSGFAVLLNPNFHALVVYRLSFFFSEHKLSILSKLLWFHNRIWYAIDIDYRARIGEKFMIVHGIGVVIGKGVIIGEGCKVYQNVTIGGREKARIVDGSERYFPELKDNVICYPSSTILGPVLIGESSIITATTLITKDVPMSTVVKIQKEISFSTLKN